MKYIKILIAVIAVAGIGWAVYEFLGSTIAPPPPSSDADGQDIKAEKIQNDIDSAIVSAPADALVSTSKSFDEAQKNINFLFRDEPMVRQTWLNNLETAYIKKFVQQAGYVFDHKQWNKSDIDCINRIQQQFPNDDQLTEIRTILDQRKQLIDYLDNVNRLCGLKPKCVGDKTYCYKEDLWNTGEANRLLNNIPTFNTKITNCPLYEQSRRDKTKSKLQTAHRTFIQTKMDNCRIEAEGYNRNPSRHRDWIVMGDVLYKDFNQYYQQWALAPSDPVIKQWKEAVKNWEEFAPEEID